MNSPTPRPPRLADQLLEWFVAPHLLESLQGDMHEEFAWQVERLGANQANWRYWREVLGFIRPSAIRLLPQANRPAVPFFNVDQLRSILNVAWRNLWRNKLYSTLNVAGLGMGLAAAVLILLWVQNELSFDTNNQHADQIYHVTNTLGMGDEAWVWDKSPLVLGEAAQRNVPGIDRITRLKKPSQGLTFRINNVPFHEEKAAFIDSTWFDTFDYQFVIGNAKQALQDPNSLILTESKARTWFRDPATAIGKFVRLDSVNLMVKAIVRDPRPNSSFQYDVLLPIAAGLQTADQRDNDRNWSNFNYELFLQLKPGLDPARLGPKLTQLYRAYKKDSTVTASLLPLTAIHFDTTIQNDDLPKGNRQTVLTIGLVGLLILVIASINYVNLSTALAGQRAKEVGVKKIIGAGRGSLFGQFLLESGLLTGLALVLAVGLIALLMPAFNNFTGKHFSLDLSNGTLWLLLLGSLVLTVLLAGIYPALLLSSLAPARVLRGINVLQLGNARFRQGLVVAQFSVAIILIVSTLVIYRQVQFVQTQNPGYQREHIFSFSVPFSPTSKATRSYLKDRLRETAGIEAVTSTNMSIIDMQSSHRGSLKWAGKADDFTPMVAQFSVEPQTRSVFNLKLTQGRWFQTDIRLDSANVILNETAVKSLGLKAPVVGQWFEFQGRRGQVIGVARDFHYRSFHEKIEPMVLFYAPGWQSELYAKIRPGATATALAAAEKIWHDRMPDQPFTYTFLDDSFARLYESEQKAGQLFSLFAGVAILISCLGLFGLATFMAGQRTKEIGIRKVLEASVSGIVALLSRDFIKLVLMAIVIASPVAWWLMHQWLADFAYKVNIDWWLFAVAGGLAVSIALLTVSFQSIRAALMNPVKSLRSE